MNRVTPLRWQQTLAYGFSEYGKSFFYHGPNLVWLYFLTDVMGIAPATAGMVILIPMIFDAVSDPLMGYLADRTRTRFGRFLPYLVLGTPLCILFFVLLFSRPALTPEAMVVYAILVAILFRVTFTIMDVPHNALLAKATADSGQRSMLAGSKMFFSSLAALTVSMGLVYMTSPENVAGQADNFQLAAICAGTIALVAIYLCAWVLRDKDRPEEEDSAVPVPGFGDFVAAVRANRLLWIIVFAGIIKVMLFPVFSKGLVYLAKYDLGDTSLSGWLLSVMTICMTLSVPVWALLGRRLSKPLLLQASHGLVVLALLVFFVFEVRDLWLLGVIVAVIGIGSGGTLAVTFAILPDLVEYGEWRSGRRVEAPIFALFTFSTKAGNGLGAGLLGILLAYIGFEANTELSERTLEDLRLVMAWVPIVGSVAVMWALRYFDLDHAMHRRITAELADRKAALP